MKIRSWIRRLFPHSVAPTLRKAPHRARLDVEVLEDRCVLSPIVVNNPTDTPVAGQIDLRQAIAQANLNGGAQTITFDSTVFSTPQTITLTGTQLVLSDTTGTETITGPTAGVTVSGGGLSRVFQVNSGVTASFSDLTITGGKVTGVGGGLYSSGTTTLTDCTVSGNSSGALAPPVTIPGKGGGVFNTGTITLSYCTISGNSGTIRGIGGGLYNSGTATLTYCTVSGNSTGNLGKGGGLYNKGTATLTACTVSGNAARGAGKGGGLYNKATATLTNCTVSGNSVIGSTSKGGGLYNHTGTTTLSDCTISGNSAGNGGGIDNVAGTVNLGNTIVATNTATTGPDAVGAFASQGNNLIGKTNGSSGWVSSDLTGTIATPLNPLLTSLGNNGGPTQTVALFVGSPALDAGNNSLIPAGITNDQRGDPRIFNGTVDIGAFEAQPAATPSFVVNTTNDDSGFFDGENSLRDAIAAATVFPGNAITFDTTVFATLQTITLTDGPLVLSSTSGTETITGPTAGVTISGGGVSGVFLVDAGVTASLSGLTITDGNATSGGGVLNSGSLTLTDCTVSSNSATFGGGVDNSGTLTLINCTVSGNSATVGDDGRGGGIYSSGSLTMTDCTVSNNTESNPYDADGGGGGLNFGFNSTATLTGCTISGNTATYGAGLDNYGTLALTNCTVSGNTAGAGGGGVFTFGGTTTLTNCTLSGNSALGRGVNAVFDGGGGVFVDGTTTLTNCTLSGNSAIGEGGGGLRTYRGTSTLTNCTVSGNSTSGSGGGVLNQGSSYSSPTTTLINCTVSGNSASVGGGLYNLTGITTLTNSIVAGNTATTAPDVSGDMTSLGNNLIGETDGSSGWISSDLTGTSAMPLDPLLASLANNGGPTQTMALLAGSPAIDAGASGTGIPTTDQRGALRGSAGLNAGSTVDIGAYEASSSYLVTSTADSSDVGTLRTAVGWANVSTNANPANIADPAPNTVVFDTTGVFATQQTITLSPSLGQLELSNPTTAETITGPAVGVAVSGGGTSRVFQIDGGVTASISGLMITGGNTSTDGGGVNNSGSLTMTYCMVSGNSSYAGCGLFNGYGAAATLTNCIVSGNSSTGQDTSSGSDASGGGLNNEGQLTLTNCTVSGNSAVFGGALYNLYGTATLTNCTVSGNTAQGGGGGVFDFLLATTTLTDCTVSGNSTLQASPFGGGGVYNGLESSLTMTNCTVNGNSDLGNGGGGVLNSLTSTATLTNCTVSGNSSTADGGGVLNTSASTVTLTNCSVSGNSANNGGGIANQGTLNITSSAINQNEATSTGGGISTTAGSATITASSINSNQVNSTGTALGGGIYSANSQLSLQACSVSFNLASAGTGADAMGGGLDLVSSTATITNSTFQGNAAYGGASSGTGGSAEGGGLFVGSDGTATISKTSFLSNQAEGGNGQSGGNGLGGGCYVASGASLALTQCSIVQNLAQGGADEPGGTMGEGIGGGVYTLGTFTDFLTTIVSNHASTGGNNLGP